ncbi:MAG TPA: SPFH domain-containing protein [Verrucomicrobiae bacterium]|jgi:hypothetical protein
MKRIIVFGLIVGAVWTAETVWLNARQPGIASALAVQQLNGGNAAAAQLRTFESLKDAAHLAAGALTLLAAWVCFAPWLKRGASWIAAQWQRRSQARNAAKTAVLALLPALLLTGCIKPYDKPEFVEIDTSETGFLIPLEGDTGQQAKFQSEDYLLQRKVAAKRVQILHRWSQEGRLEYTGRWIPTVRLVKVNRSPLTREWTTPQGPQSVGQLNRGGASDKAIWIESADSVGFSMGFTCTAFISEEDAAKFLYWYPSGSLANVMDNEVRGRIQQVAAEVAAKYPLDQLRSRKQEIVDEVKQDVTAFFATRGVTVTTVGMFGGMTYENPAIQKSIDETFIAQQLKVVSEAKFDAQRKENERIELEANATAEKARREAQGQADARKTAAQAEAEAIREVNKASQEAANNPLLLQLKTLEVEKARVEKWDGRFPQWWLGGGGAAGPNILFQMPVPTAAQR